jgi:hypothetical protein
VAFFRLVIPEAFKESLEEVRQSTPEEFSEVQELLGQLERAEFELADLLEMQGDNSRLYCGNRERASPMWVALEPPDFEHRTINVLQFGSISLGLVPPP